MLILNKNNKKIYTIMNKIYANHGHKLNISLLSITREIKKGLLSTVQGKFLT